MAMDYGALAEGLQRGFSIGMSFVDMENRKKQQEIENQRAKEELNIRKAEVQKPEILFYSRTVFLFQLYIAVRLEIIKDFLNCG